MRTGRGMPRGLPDLELHNRSLLPAVLEAPVLALDAVGLPVVRAGAVQPEPGIVEEGRRVAEALALLLGLPDVGLVADEALLVLLPGRAHLHVDRAPALEPALEGRRAADGDRRAGLR